MRERAESREIRYNFAKIFWLPTFFLVSVSFTVNFSCKQLNMMFSKNDCWNKTQIILMVKFKVEKSINEGKKIKLNCNIFMNIHDSLAVFR